MPFASDLAEQQQLIFAVLAAVEQSQASARSSVAALAFLVFDVCTTLEREVEHIWATKWTIAKALYLLVRYYSLISLIILNARDALPFDCITWLAFVLVSTLVLEAAVQVIVILRIYALYLSGRAVTAFMITGFLIEVTVMAVTLGLTIPRVLSGMNCMAYEVPAELVIYSTAAVVFETCLFGLMMVKAIASTGEKLGSTRLLQIFVRDGAIFFAAVYFAMIANTFIFTLAPPVLVTLGFPWLIAVLGSAGPRLVLGLRAEHKPATPSSLSEVALSTPIPVYSAINSRDPDTPRQSGPSAMRFVSNESPVLPPLHPNRRLDLEAGHRSQGSDGGSLSYAETVEIPSLSQQMSSLMDPRAIGSCYSPSLVASTSLARESDVDTASLRCVVDGDEGTDTDSEDVALRRERRNTARSSLGNRMRRSLYLKT